MKYIFLTGHHTLYMACLIAIILSIGGLDGWMLNIGGGMLLGFVMAFFPAIMQPSMRKITGNDDIAFGHFGSFGYWISAQVGKIVGKGSKSSEEINFPKGISFMRDTMVSISLVMFICFFIVCLKAQISTPAAAMVIFGGTHWLLFTIIQAITFSGGIYIVLSGVRLVLAEIVPAFKGISEKLVPNSKPALDCPIVFPYAQNAVLIGFISSFIGGIVGLAILALLTGAGINVALILPGAVPHFFCGATAGVFGNAEGGLRGCVIGSFIHGLVITFLPALLMPVMASLGFMSTTFSDTDFTLVGIIFGNIAKLVDGIGLFGIICVVFASPIVYNFVFKRKSNA